MRRLPVINSAAPEDEAAAARPRWQWILIGAGFTAVFWIPVALLVLPLALPLAEAATTRLFGVPILGNPAMDEGQRAALVGGIGALSLVVTFVLAAAGAGAVMGRFATRARARDAAIAVVVCAGLLTVLTMPGIRTPWLLSLASFAALAPAGAAAAYAVARRFAARRSS